MASNESLHDQIAAAIEASLNGIQGDGGTTYWNSPAAVVRVLWFEDALLDASLGEGPIYAVRPGEEEHTEGETGGIVGRVRAEMDVFILCLQPYGQSDTPFKPGSPSRWTVVNRMVRDVLRKLLVDVQLLTVGSAVENVFATPVIVDRDRWLEGWAAAEIHFRVSYTYGDGTP